MTDTKTKLEEARVLITQELRARGIEVISTERDGRLNQILTAFEAVKIQARVNWSNDTLEFEVWSEFADRRGTKTFKQDSKGSIPISKLADYVEEKHDTYLAEATKKFEKKQAEQKANEAIERLKTEFPGLKHTAFALERKWRDSRLELNIYQCPELTEEQFRRIIPKLIEAWAAKDDETTLPSTTQELHISSSTKIVVEARAEPKEFRLSSLKKSAWGGGMSDFATLEMKQKEGVNVLSLTSHLDNVEIHIKPKVTK